MVITFTIYGGKADVTQAERIYSIDNKPTKKVSDVENKVVFKITSNETLSTTYFKVKPSKGYSQVNYSVVVEEGSVLNEIELEKSYIGSVE